MPKLNFELKSFFRTMGIFVVLTCSWTYLSIITKEFTNNDKGLVTGIGFLLLFSFCIYFGQQMKEIKSLFFLIVLSFGTFLISSFVLGSLIGQLFNSILLYSISNSLFVAVVMTFFLNKLKAIDFFITTVVLVWIFLIVAYYFLNKYEQPFYISYDIHPRITMFVIFQFALIIPLALGFSIKKKKDKSE